jgi:hypothetical protein
MAPRPRPPAPERLVLDGVSVYVLARRAEVAASAEMAAELAWLTFRRRVFSDRIEALVYLDAADPLGSLRLAARACAGKPLAFEAVRRLAMGGVEGIHLVLWDGGRLEGAAVAVRARGNPLTDASVTAHELAHHALALDPSAAERVAAALAAALPRAWGMELGDPRARNLAEEIACEYVSVNYFLLGRREPDPLPRRLLGGIERVARRWLPLRAEALVENLAERGQPVWSAIHEVALGWLERMPADVAEVLGGGLPYGEALRLAAGLRRATGGKARG